MKKKFLLLYLLASTFFAHTQNVGIGTTTPVQKLHVEGASFLNGNVGIGAITPAFPLSFAPLLGDKISLWSNSANSYGFGIQGSLLQIHTDVSAADIAFGYGSSADFTERMRIKGNGNVGIGTTTPNASAILELSDSTKGFLLPRMTAAQRTAISSPAEGLLVYQTNDSKGYYYFISGAWTSLTDEKTYTSLTICTQNWMDKNLDVTTYRNGDPIPYVTDQASWAALTTGAWCYYNNDPSTNATYGKLYNWYAVNDPRGLAPVGWHVPTDDEWTTLETCLGGSTVAGGKMKVTGTTTWTSPNTGATNSSGFAGLPGGVRDGTGPFGSVGNFGSWWSSTVLNTPAAWSRYLIYSDGIFSRNSSLKRLGLSVRCLKD